MNDKVLRNELMDLLKGGNAHMRIEEAVKDFPLSKINNIFPNGEYSTWHLLEHIRITQWDILDFIKNPKYKYMKWPDDYWPPPKKKATKIQWKETIEKIKKDKKTLEKIVSNPRTDLFAKIKWGEGQTILKEILVVSDHNAYHIGEFSIMRQAMDTWNR